MSIRFVPPREPICDPQTGIVSRTWYLFLQTLMEPGSADDVLDLLKIGPSNPGSDAAADELHRAFDALTIAPPIVVMPPGDDQSPTSFPLFVQLDDVLPVIGALRDEITALRKRVDDLSQGPGL